MAKLELICSPFNDQEFILSGNIVTYFKVLTSEQLLCKSLVVSNPFQTKPTKQSLLAKNRSDYYEDLQCEPVAVISKISNQRVIFLLQIVFVYLFV
jgi:hypothetical protein